MPERTRNLVAASPAEASSLLHTYRGTVYPWHCDHMGHMNVMWYAGKFDEATWQLAGALGLTRAGMEESGCGLVAAEQTTQYRAELLAGDLIDIHTKVVGSGRSTLRFEHEMRNAATGVIAATSTLVGVHIDRRTRRPHPLPPAVQEALQAANDSVPAWMR